MVLDFTLGVTVKTRSKKTFRPGFTLIELSFSLAFYTTIVTIALATFLGILGVYSRAQNLTRTQTVARSTLDTLIKDLRTAQNVRHYALYNSNDTETGTLVNPIRDINENLRYYARDYWCITSDTNQRGYVNLWNASIGRFQLVRMANGCNTFKGYEQLVDNDVWSDTTSNPGNPGNTRSDAPGERSLKIDPVTNKDYRGLVINRIGDSDPAVWEVQVSAYSGKRVPPETSNLLDQFSASTTLKTVVSTRE